MLDFKLLFESAELSKFTAEEKVKYEQDMTTERDRRNQIAYAREEGRKEGAREERFRLAKALLANGVKMEVIVASTGLSEEEIGALK